MTTPELLFLVWLRRGICKSHSPSLYSGKSPVGYDLCIVWCSVGLSRNCKGGLIELEGPFCRGKKEKDMEVYPVVHFLDSLEGKK